MKTKDDFLGDYDVSDDWGPAGYSDEKVEKAMDEYAEEYAKAFLGFIRVNNDPEFAARNGDDLLRRFKESLKK